MSIFKGLLQDEEFLFAAGLLQQGSQGKSIGGAIFPAISGAAQVKKLTAGNQKDQFRMLSNEEAQAEGFDTSNNQKYQKNITTNKILPFNVKKDNSVTVNNNSPENKQESKFSETVGAGQGTVFNEIIQNR